MNVETYEVPEVDCNGEVESDEEAIALIEKLGLTGQQKLLKKNESGEQVRTPYRKMTAEELFVYRTLCPKTDDVRKYDDGPIPVRVLQVAAHAMDLFEKVQVWYPDNADVRDPVLVGVNGDGYSRMERFILARWGDVLESLSELHAKAVEIAVRARKSKLLEIRAEVDSNLAALDGDHRAAAVIGHDLPTFYAK